MLLDDLLHEGGGVFEVLVVLHDEFGLGVDAPEERQEEDEDREAEEADEHPDCLEDVMVDGGNAVEDLHNAA